MFEDTVENVRQLGQLMFRLTTGGTISVGLVEKLSPHACHLVTRMLKGMELESAMEHPYWTIMGQGPHMFDPHVKYALSY